MRSDTCIGKIFFGAIFTPVTIYNLFFGKIYEQCTQISIMPLKFETIGRFSGFRIKDLEIRLYESKLYESKLYELSLYESKLYEMLLSR